MFEASKISLLSILLVLPGKGNHFEQVIRAYSIPARKDKHAAYNETLRKIEEGKRRRIEHEALLLSPVYRIAISTAASLVLIFLLQLLLFSKTTFEADQQASTFRLPDQSRVVLSANSTISYPKYFWNRKLRLQGEAYFEVKKGENFTVKTNEGEVSVLGTRFIVSETDETIQVSCFEGQVAYTNKKLEQLIPAGASMEFQEDVVLSSTETEHSFPETAIFSTSYSGENLRQVTQDLEGFFNISIQLQTNQPYFFSGHLETANLESAMKIISRSLNLQYSIVSDEVIVLKEKQKSYEKN